MLSKLLDHVIFKTPSPHTTQHMHHKTLKTPMMSPRHAAAGRGAEEDERDGCREEGG